MNIQFKLESNIFFWIFQNIKDDYFSVFWTDRIFHASYRGVFDSIMENGISGMGKFYINMGIGVPKKEEILSGMS